MKKVISAVIILLIVLIFCPSVDAQQESEEFRQITDEINSEIRNSLDESVKSVLDEENISVSDSESITGLSAKNIFQKLIDMFKESVKAPIVMLGKILAVSIIYAALKSMYLEGSAIDKVYGIMCVTCIIVIMADTISDSFQSMQNGIESINKFMISYIPIFSAITASGGNVVTSGSYSAATLLICEAASAVTSKLLMPFLSAILAITIVSAVNPQLKFAGVADSVKKLTTWLLATVMTVFVGLMALQGVTGASADNLTTRTLRFAASSFIPVIGSSVSEAFSAVKGSMGVIRSTAGSIGIIVVFLIAVKPFLSLLAIKLTIWLGKITNDLLGLTETSELLRNTNSLLSIGLSMLIAFTSAFIISTAAVMAVVSGGV